MSGPTNAIIGLSVVYKALDHRRVSPNIRARPRRAGPLVNCRSRQTTIFPLHIRQGQERKRARVLIAILRTSHDAFKRGLVPNAGFRCGGRPGKALAGSASAAALGRSTGAFYLFAYEAMATVLQPFELFRAGNCRGHDDFH